MVRYYIKKYQLSKIGEFHTNHNEDFLVTNEIGNNKIMIAVMDGCSMGTESHFASLLIGKLLRKLSRDIHYKEFIYKETKSLKSILKGLMRDLFVQLKHIKNQLNLETHELLSTLILGVINSKEKTAEIITIGDGLIYYNGYPTEYEQENKPDYIGYHLNQDFEDWFKKQNQFLSLNNIRDLSIVTDGIFTFKKFNLDKYPEINESQLVTFLLDDKTGNQNQKMLLKKMIEIEKKWGLKPSDDLTIIRLIEE